MLSDILERHGRTIANRSGASARSEAGAGRPLGDPVLWHPDGPGPVLVFLERDPNEYDYDAWVERAHAVKAALGPTREDHYDAFEDWSAKAGTEPDAARKLWKSIRTSRVGWRFLPYPAEADFDDMPTDMVDAPPERLATLGLDDLAGLGDPWDFVQGWICDGQVSIWSGKPNVGKSFVALDLGMHVALGWKWHGHAVDRGGVIYIAGEGANGLKRRVEAFRQEKGHEETKGAWMRIVPRAVKLRDIRDVDALIETVLEMKDLLGGPARLIIIDTLSRALAGGDENSSADMGLVVMAVERIKRATGAHIMIVHHTGKDPSKGGRGHSLISGAVDTEFLLAPGGDGGPSDRTMLIDNPKQKEKGRRTASGLQLRVVDLGVDRRGDKITSCVVDPWRPEPKISEKSSTCLLILNEMLPDDGQSPGKLDAWRTECFARLELATGQTRANLRRTFNHAREELLRVGKISINGEFVDIL